MSILLFLISKLINFTFALESRNLQFPTNGLLNFYQEMQIE